MRHVAAGGFFPQTLGIAGGASFGRASQPDEFHVGQDFADAGAVLTQRRDERGGDVDAALVELFAAKRHVRQVQQARVLIHVEVGNGLPHFVAVEQDVTGGFVDHAFRER